MQALEPSCCGPSGSVQEVPADSVEQRGLPLLAGLLSLQESLLSPALCLCSRVRVSEHAGACVSEFTDSKGSMKGGDSEPIIFSLMVPRVPSTTKRRAETSAATCRRHPAEDASCQSSAPKRVWL